MFGFSRNTEPWLMLKIDTLGGSDGTVKGVQVSGAPSDVHRVVNALVRGVGGQVMEELEAEDPTAGEIMKVDVA